MRTMLAFVILPNLLTKLPLILLGERPPLNLDYAGIGLVAGFLGDPLASLGYALLTLLDTVVRFAPVFHFSLPGAASGIVQLLSTRPVVVGSIAILVIGLFLVFGYGATKLAMPNEPAAYRSRMVLAAIALLIGALDASNGTGEIFRSERAWLNWNIAGSASWAAFCAVREQTRRATGLEGDHRLRIPAASRRLFSEVESRDRLPYTRVAVVLMESWGEFTRPDANTAVLDPIVGSAALGEQYEVRVGTTPFHGPTTAAEFRELCEWQGTYLTAPKTPTGRCLPELLRRLGYRTISIHGFHRQFFDRNRWYPLIGFDSSYFDDQIRPYSGGRACGSLFAGACDADAVKIVRQELLSGGGEQRKLVYWLTLSSHFPVDKHAATGSHFNCVDDRDAAKHQVICVLMSVWHHNFENIRAIALDPALPPTRWLIVGDHRPPLLESSESALFSPYVVPYVELIPRPSKALALERRANVHAPHQGDEELY